VATTRHLQRTAELILAGLTLVGPRPIAAATSTPWGTNGTVGAIAVSGNTVYLGGTFTIAGPATGSAMVISAATGEPIGSSLGVAGTVRVVASDGDGGWFVGGSIVGIAGRPCSNLAHVLKDGSVDPWDPVLDGPVRALARAGNTLYVGGDFRSADGQPRSAAAAFDTQTGKLTPWDPEVNGFVGALAAYHGSVFVGGHFTQIGNAAHACLAKLSGDLGAAEPWSCDANTDVTAFAVSNDTLYVGGYFGLVQGQWRNMLAAVNAETGGLLAFDPDGVSEIIGDYPVPSGVRALAIVGGSLYVGGHFVGMGGQPRIGLAEVNRLTGIATTWNPVIGPIYDAYPSPTVHTIDVQGTSIFIGGEFSTINGLERGYAARFDWPNGTLSDWNPRASDYVFALGSMQRQVMLAGGFTTLWSWQPRNCLAALDATTGALLPWNPQPDGYEVNALAAGGGKIYVSGAFSTIGGQPRSNIAAVDSISGLATPWDPQSNGYAFCMKLSGEALYAGGVFSSIGGASRPYAAKLDTVTGAATAWNPMCNDWVTSMAVDGGSVYLGGWFGQAGGQSRAHLAEVDTALGLATSWAPDPNGILLALALDDSIVAVGGSFTMIGGAAHSSLAVLDRQSGAAKDWNLDMADALMNITISDGEIYVGGDYSFIGGQPRHRIAAINARTGKVEDWGFEQDNLIWATAPRDHGVWLGGAFTFLGDKPAPGIASVDGPTAGWRAGTAPIELGSSFPNPTTDVADVSYTLRVDGPVSLAVYDLAGRRVSTIVPRQIMSAGPHRVSIRTAGWKPGCYFYRLESAGISRTRKMVVVR
jgi:hypothetical protein